MKIKFYFSFLLIICINHQLTFAQDDFMESFVKNNPDKSAFYFSKNDSIAFGINEDKMNPLASLSKTIIALEFAYQVGREEIDPDMLVSYEEINRFAVGDDNFANWTKQIKKDKILSKGQVPIKYVAQGMIRYSANACADYLLSKLGLDKVNKRLEELQIKHESIFPFTASILVAFNYQNEDKAEFLKKAKDWSRDEFRSKVNELNDKFINDDEFLKNIKKEISASIYKDLDYDALWSDNFSLSTAKEYTKLIAKINNREFDPSMNDILTFLFETWAMNDNSELKGAYDGLAYKGAGTNSLINVWLYLRDKEGSEMQFVGLFNHLNQEEYKKIEASISNFGFQLCTDEVYMNKWKEIAGE